MGLAPARNDSMAGASRVATYSDSDLSFESWHVGSHDLPDFRAYVTRQGHLISPLSDVQLRLGEMCENGDGVFDASAKLQLV